MAYRPGIIFLTAILSEISYSSQFVWDGIFVNADLTFVFTPECSNLSLVEDDFHYFQAVRTTNPYTPLHHVTHCHTRSMFHFPKQAKFKDSYVSQDLDKSTRYKSIFRLNSKVE